MQPNVRMECPKCSRPLQNFNGHIGYCSLHKWVCPEGLIFEAEAAEQNRRDAAAAEQSRLERERQMQEAQAQEIRAQHQSAVHKAIAAIIALALIAAAVVFFVVRPSINYDGAANKFALGEYQAARDGYSALGGYKDAPARVLLCDAMIALQEGRAEDAVEKLEQLTNDGQEDVARQLADALLPVMTGWKARGLTPQALLFLLSKVSIIDPNGALDVNRLMEEGHAALLDEVALSVYTADADGDGNSELVVLNSDYTVSVYRMAADSNVRIAVDNAAAAACAETFGNLYRDTTPNASVACFSEAYRLLPNDDTRAALTSAYQLCAASYESVGDMSAALSNAQSAMETAGTADAFAFFYDMNLRNCKNGRDAAAAIAMWNAFAADFKSALTRFSAQERWQADAARLHISRASELAVKKDEGCIAELRTAAELGGDAAAAIAEAESHFEPGLSLARLRLLEIDLLGGDVAAEQKIRSDMAGEVRAAIGEWKVLGLAPTNVPVLIRLADEQGIDLTGIDCGAIYEEAAVASTGDVAQYAFVDWNEDGYKELLTLDGSGRLALYGLDTAWTVIASIDTKLPNASYTLVDESAPLLLILSSNNDELLAVTGTSDKLTVLFREQKICRYARNGSAVTFSRLLEGSIARYSDYAYEAVGTANRPVRVGIDWQQNDYPLPECAAAAIQRYFEAKTYDIPSEAALLIGESAAGAFSTAFLASMAVPDAPGMVNAAAYCTQEKLELFEVTYPSAGQRVRAWLRVEYIDGWKLTGASNAYGEGMSTDDIDYSAPLISLNVETVNTISTKGGRNAYRLLIPAAGRIRLLWQSGSKAASRVSHTVAMQRDSLTGDSVFSFQLQPSASKQRSKDLFVAPGVYYVTVEANISDAEQYHLTIGYNAEPHVELENNDTPEKATAVECNTGYAGTLSSAQDADYFSFVLNETSAVNVTFRTPGNGSKTATHTLTVVRAAGGRLSTVSVPGNAQLSETGNLYLSPGTYLVQVAKGSAFTNDEYILTVKVDQNGYMEAEPNDTPEAATAVPVNEDIHASIGQEGDIDCFSFTLAGDAVVQPKLAFAPTDSAAKTYVLTIMDSSRRELLKANVGGKESAKVISPVALTAGTYTVKIENPRFVRQDYTLRLVSMAVDRAEKEPNDSAALATALTIGQPRAGVLTTTADVDYYKVSFAEPSTVTLRFSFTQSVEKSTAFVLTVEQNGKTQWTAKVKGDSGGMEQRLQFPAGEYYIWVKPSAWLGMVYTITLE